MIIPFSKTFRSKKFTFICLKFLDDFIYFCCCSVFLGRFIPAIRSIVPFLLGISNLKPVRFYISDVIACSLWGAALAFLVIISGTFI